MCVCFKLWGKPWTCRLEGAYIWAVLSQGAQDRSNTLVLTLVLRDHLNGAGVVWANILESSESLVTLLNLWVQGTGDSQGGKRDDSERTHIE